LEATDRLKKLNYKIDRSRSSYEELKFRLENSIAGRINVSSIKKSALHNCIKPTILSFPRRRESSIINGFLDTGLRRYDD
jgi:hypothetical protein